MSQGLKNLQTSARSCARRERMLDTSSAASDPNSLHSVHGTYGGLDDSGIEIDLEAEYDADGASEHSGGSNGYGGYGHGRMDSGGSSASGRGGGGYYGDVNGGQGGSGLSGHGSRLPSMDMGIDAIINRPGGGR
jgi:hypothetical protein